MAVPKRRKSKAKRDSRRATHNLKASAYVICPQCDGPKIAHRLCATCGYYKGFQVLEAKGSGE